MPSAVIESAEQLSESVRLYTLRAVRGDFSFSPGQFISFMIPVEGRAEKAVRAYSFASQPHELPLFRLCVREIDGGVGTEYLRSQVGHEVETSAVQGGFIIPPGSKKNLFIGSGVGVAPIRSQILSFINNDQHQARLLYRYRDQELLFAEDWKELEKSGRFSLVPIRINEYNQEYEKLLAKCMQTDLDSVLVVGSPGFVKQNTETLKEIGYSRDRIITDIWEA